MTLNSVEILLISLITFAALVLSTVTRLLIFFLHLQESVRKFSANVLIKTLIIRQVQPTCNAANAIVHGNNFEMYGFQFVL